MRHMETSTLNLSIAGWLYALQRIYHPEKLVYVGFGDGSGVCGQAIEQLSIQDVTLIESDTSKYRQILAKQEQGIDFINDGELLNAVNAIVTPKAGQFPYFFNLIK